MCIVRSVSDGCTCGAKLILGLVLNTLSALLRLKPSPLALEKQFQGNQSQYKIKEAKTRFHFTDNSTE